MRYGHQPMSEINAMTMDEISLWSEEIVQLIELENNTGRQEG